MAGRLLPLRLREIRSSILSYWHKQRNRLAGKKSRIISSNRTVSGVPLVVASPPTSVRQLNVDGALACRLHRQSGGRLTRIMGKSKPLLTPEEDLEQLLDKVAMAREDLLKIERSLERLRSDVTTLQKRQNISGKLKT